VQVELLESEAVGVNVELAQLVDPARAAEDWRGVGLVDVVVVGAIDQPVDVDAEVIGEILPDVAQLLFDDRNVLADSLGRGIRGGGRRHRDGLLNLLDLRIGLDGLLAQVAHLAL